MKFAIVGAGAIGAFLGAMLARAGECDAHRARAPRHAAARRRVRGEIGDFQVNVNATDDPQTVGEVDVVVLTPQDAQRSSHGRKSASNAWGQTAP
jgi:2-dehydropantoate 2-reductase